MLMHLIDEKLDDKEEKFAKAGRKQSVHGSQPDPEV